MTLGISQLQKPSQATWQAKAVAEVDGQVGMSPLPSGAGPAGFPTAEVAWYGVDRVKLTLKDFGPAHIRQAYLSGAGRDVIVDLVRVVE
jgi:hypothetical protein